MWFNLLVIFLILFLGHIFSRGTDRFVNSDKNRLKYIAVISLVLIAQSGLRNVAVGSDTYAYYLTFEEIKNTSWSSIFGNFYIVYQLGEGKDPGFALFEKIIKIFSNEYQIFLIVIAILFFVALGNFILKNTTKLTDAIIAFLIYSVLFYSFFSITGIRQTITTAAALYAFEFIKKRRILPFIILILTASTIHKSLLVFMPFYFIARIKNSKYLNWAILLLFPIFMIFRNSISAYFKQIGGFEDYGINEQAGTFTFTVLFILVTVAALVQSKIILKNNPKAYYFFNAFALALLFIPLTWVNPSAMRVVQYFSIYMLLLIPAIINSFSTISVKLKRDMIIGLIIVLILLMIKANANALPYGFFWEEMRLQ